MGTLVLVSEAPVTPGRMEGQKEGQFKVGQSPAPAQPWLGLGCQPWEFRTTPASEVLLTLGL